jgi:uncharacterized protein
MNMDRRLFCASGLALLAAPAAAYPPKRASEMLIEAARRQVGVTLSYDPAYTRLAFPGGDVPRAKGVCTDVVIRAYRDAFGIDLQALVNADMKAAFSAYPKRWGLRTTDRNIDHRRVPNLQTFLKRQRAQLPIPEDGRQWKPGDIFTSLVGGNLPHIGIVSYDRGRSGRYMILHNIGGGARQEDALLDHKITGRYRWKVEA